MRPGNRASAPVAGPGRIEWGEPQLASLSAAWEGLDAAMPAPSLFLTEAYQAALRRLPARGTDYGAVVVRGPETGAVEALMPLMRRRRLIGPSLSTQFLIHPDDVSLLRNRARYQVVPVRQISPVIRLRGLDSRGGLLSAPDVPPEHALAAVMTTLARDLTWDIGLFPVPERHLAAWREAAGAAGLIYLEKHYNRHFHMLARAAPLGELLQRASANLRKTVRQAERRIQAAGITVTLASGREAAARALPELDAAAQHSWKSPANDPDVPLFVPWDADLRRFVGSVVESGSTDLEPVLVTVSAPSGAKATQLWMRGGNRLMALVTYFDQALHTFSPGRLMLLAALDWAAANGIEEVDFNATSPWVAPFSDLIEPYALVTLGSRTTWGRAVHRLARIIGRRGLRAR